MHPCRREYNITDTEGNKVKIQNNKVMSAKDLCALPFIEKLKNAGITAFKIEGRNREPEYVDAVVRVYRGALDKKFTEQEVKEGVNELNKVYNKGFSSGFFLGVPTSDDFSKQEHSSASLKKEFIGKIEYYFPKVEVAAIKVMSGKLKLGDDILILGKDIGIVRDKIERMEINHRQVKSVRKGQSVGIKIPKVKKGCAVYLVVKR